MVTLQSMSAAERRSRLARRHHLADDTRAPDVVILAEHLVGLHASDPATVYLSAQARVPGLLADDVERALYDDRTLVKHLAMRRTMFVLPTTLLPVVQAACTDAILVTQRARLRKEIEQSGVARDGARWLDRAEAATMAALDEQGPSTGAQLSRAVPILQTKITYAEGRSWGGQFGVTTRVLTILAAAGRIVRDRPQGRWTSSQHRWGIAPPMPKVPAGDARVDLVRRWLATFGPATMTDLTWWTGLGVGKVRPALQALAVEEVDLDGDVGLVLPGDVEPAPAVGPWVAVLPALDPTTMGWQRRDWYLGPHGSALFDRNGNAGPTVWCDGRIVGGWAQRASGELVHRLLDDVGRDATAAIESELARLQAWLGDTVVTPRFPAPLDKQLRAGV